MIRSSDDVMRSIRERSVPEPNTGCWLWTGPVCVKGYGVGRWNRVTRSHRVSWAAFRGGIPAGMCVCHKCDTPSCVNPDHLFLGTNADNVRDRLQKGRSRYAYGELAGSAKLTADDVRCIRASSGTGAALSRAYGVSRNQIRLIRNRVKWKHVA